ncbi:hypothetical protein BHY_0151 [Borrelia nietonii YOR]|uniref:Uncharacterized protein n=1 Tax=Borrelia nietonii YOR TaxID=1293576 RepID=A0ABM5PG97_9SPIR|nr:hypothetical protein BHY_0151 [Borrelia nietonii YOR]
MIITSYYYTHADFKKAFYNAQLDIYLTHQNISKNFFQNHWF